MKDDSVHLLHFLSEKEPYVLIYFYILMVAELNHIVLYLFLCVCVYVCVNFVLEHICSMNRGTSHALTCSRVEL